MPSSWLDEAARLPLAFALVREDPLLDAEALALLPAPVRVLMVASGGCTAALLASNPAVEKLHLVDANPAQLALARVKLKMRGYVPHRLWRCVLGHQPLDLRGRMLVEIQKELGLPAEIFGPPELVERWGPDFAGRYERLFARLQESLPSRELEELLRLNDPAEQARRSAPGTPLGDALDAAYDEVLALPNLIRLFGEGATQNPVEPFSRHFARRTRAVLASLPAASNPYLWLMLRGSLPPGVALDWMDAPTAHSPRETLFSQGFMADVLARHHAEYDFVHLSNILDWLPPAEATRTLALACQTLRPGGIVLIRQLNSSLDIPALGPMFDWDRERAADMLRRDRSFFYRALHLGRNP